MKQLTVIFASVLLLASSVECALAQPASAGTHWTAAQLDQLTAPIALYPDPLLGSILASSTYPLEVVEAARWLDDPAHAVLKGDALGAALEGQGWDPSVKSLVPFPAVLHFMDDNLEWTEQLGDAFLAQQSEVMDSIQRLRQRALAQGTLRSTPQQIVASDQDMVTIEPASGDVVYVPYYVPGIYGSWPWPDYPPYVFAPPPDVMLGDAFITFGVGVGFAVFEPWWGWYGCSWPDRGVVNYPPYPGYPGKAPPHVPHPGKPQRWQHDPQHRDGVPYREAATASRYLGTEATLRPFRGFPAPASTPPPAAAPFHTVPAPAPAAPLPRPSYVRPMAPGSGSHAGPPAFESFGHGLQVRDAATRGASSRSTAPSAPSGSAHPGHR